MNSIKLTIGLAIFTILALISTTLLAQKKSTYEVGINAGTLIYQGDLAKNDWGNFKNLKPAIGLYVSKDLDSYFALRANLLFGKIGADESQITDPSWKQYRNFKFTTSVTELSTVLVWNIIGNSQDRYSRKLSPYVFGGVGVTFLDVRRDWHQINTTVFDAKSSTIIGLGIDTVHNTPKMLPLIPIGVGLNYAITPKISIKAEATYRFTFSDYVDGFSYAGSPYAKDKYYGFSLGVSYKIFNNSFSCPPVKR